MMSLSEVEKSELVRQLEAFNGILDEYGVLALKLFRGKRSTEQQISALTELRQNALRSYGGLKPAIEKYSDRAVVLIPGGERDAFILGLGLPFHQDTFVALQRAKDAVNMAIGNLQSLTPPETSQVQAPHEAVFPSGKPYDAYKAIMDILTAATKKLIIVDTYVDSTLFTRLENVQPKVQIQILTLNMKGDFQLAGQQFKKQREEAQQGTLEIRKSGEFHDRFIVADNKVFHLGASIKDAGTKTFLLKELEGSDIKTTLMEIISRYWNEAEIVL